METFLCIVGLIIIGAVWFEVNSRMCKKEMTAWYKDVASTVKLIIENNQWFLDNESIGCEKFVTIFYVFANFARAERLATKLQDRLNEVDDDTLRGLVEISPQFVKDKVDIEESNRIIDRTFKALSPYRENKEDIRGLYYELLYKAFASELHCSITNPSLFLIFDMITLGMASKLNQQT